MRSTEASDAEQIILTTDSGLALLAEVEANRRPTPADVARWRRATPAEGVAAAIRLAEGRRKGASKFALAASMWFDPIGVEQSTPEGVARHKARRFAGGGPVVDLCSGIGGDSIALAGSSGSTLAVDLDLGMGRRALWNARVHGLQGRVQPIRARAEAFAIPAGARVHVDPDRRAAGARKANALRDYAPGPDALLALARSARGGAIKLGPSSDFGAQFGRHPFEIELVSLGGECKEATLWFGDLGDPRVRRRATHLPSGATWTDLDGGSTPDPITPDLASYLFDPDPTLDRAGLLDAFAAAHGLRRIAAGVDLLTGPVRLASPFLATFEVLGLFPLDVKLLRREVAARGLGPLEIKTRGLRTTPEAYRAQLRPEGPTPATWILVAGRGTPGRAILAGRSWT